VIASIHEERELAGVDVPTRAAVAKKLAAYARAPQPIVRRLARDVIEVADPILRCSPGLSGEDLLAIIRDFGPRHAAAIGVRNGSAAPVADGPSGDDGRAEAVGLKRVDMNALATGPDGSLASLDPGTAAPAAAESGAAGSGAAGSEPVLLGDHFLSADSSERRRLLANLDDGARPEPVLAAGIEEAVPELEAAALQHQPDDFARGLQRCLKIPADTAQKIVADETGEPVLVAAKALAMPSEVLLRILLFLNPAIGHSVERVFDLVNLYDQLSREAALQVVSSWQNRHAGERRVPRYQSVHWDDERRVARRVFADHSRRFPLQVADDRAYPVRTGVVRSRG
jgi:hypothetical protein